MQSKWVGSKMPGKPWNGTTAPMCVLHTLEFNGWPQTWKWDSPSHFVYNPNTQELRQYVSTNRSAYSLRNNALEDDYLTLQIELWGKAKDVPGYSDEWYEGVAALLSWVNGKYGIPLTFADFSVMDPGRYAPQRMTAEATDKFTGFLGHGHFGRGVDEHWDPGMLDVKKVLSYIEDEDMVTHYKIGERTATYEDVTWLLFQLAGGIIDPNKHSSQVSGLLGKTDVRLPTSADFDKIATLTGMSSFARANLTEFGLYRFGKEIAALRQYAWDNS